MLKVDIEIASKKDWVRIIEIYNQSIKTGYSTADLSSVTLESRKEWFSQHNSIRYPIYIAKMNGQVVGWCSLSPHRPGREALKTTSEISYYIDEAFHRRGIAKKLINHAIDQATVLGLKNLFALMLDINIPSIKILENFGFQKWGHLPNVAEIHGKECGQFIYGIRVYDDKIVK